MHNSLTARLLSLVFALLVVLSIAPTALALRTGPEKPTTTIDCGDPGNRDSCFECCGNSCGEGALFCCRYTDPNQCIIVNKPQPTQVSVSLGGAQLTFERYWQVNGESGREYFDVTLQAVIRVMFPQETQVNSLNLKTRLTGQDAPVGSLLYPVAFLGIGSDALEALKGLGYDVSFMGDAPTESCTAMFSSEMCTALANQLSQSIDASLAMGDPAARDAFRLGVGSLGFPICGFVP